MIGSYNYDIFLRFCAVLIKTCLVLAIPGYSLHGQDFILPEAIELPEQQSGPQLLWIGPDNLYVGQSSIYMLLLKGRSTKGFPESIEIRNPDNSVFEEVYGIGTIREYEVDEQKVYDIPIASFILTPGREALLQIPEARVRIEGTEYTSAALLVEVKLLTRKVHGIGQISFSYRIDKTQIDPGASAILTVELRGEGNLPFINFEGPQSESLVISLLDDAYNTEVGSTGYSGTRILRYGISASSGVQHRVQIPNFVVYDTAINEYFQQSGDELLLLVGQKDTTETFTVHEKEPAHGALQARVLNAQLYKKERLLFLFFIPMLGGLIAVCIRLVWKHYG